jgi:GntP family gluconate:H+ symporter
MAPVARTVSARSGVPLIACLGALNAGIMATHTIVPPTPGPLAAAGTLNVDLGHMIALGLIVSFSYSICGWLWVSTYCAKKIPRVDIIEGVERLPDGKLTIDDLMIKSDKPLPSTFMSFAALLVPILLICGNSFGRLAVDPSQTTLLNWMGFVGHPIIALGLGVLTAFCLDTKALSKEQIGKWFNKSVDTSAFIILATGTAGSYGFVLRASGVGEFMGEAIANSPFPPIFIPFFVTLLLVVSNGSATVSLVTGSGIMLPLMPAFAANGIPPVMVALALTAGASFFYHVNASHYWVVVRSANLSMKEGFYNVSGGTAVGSIGAMIAVFVLSLFVR